MYGHYLGHWLTGLIRGIARVIVILLVLGWGTLAAQIPLAQHSVQELLAIANDSSDQARQLWALYQLKDRFAQEPIVVELFLKIAGDTNAVFLDRIVSVHGLRQGANREARVVSAMQALVQMAISQINGVSEKELLACEAIETIAAIGPPAYPASGTLIQVATNETRWLPLRLAAVKALGAMGSAAQTAAPHLETIFFNAREDRQFRLATIEALASIGSDSTRVLKTLCSLILSQPRTPPEELKAFAQAFAMIGAAIASNTLTTLEPCQIRELHETATETARFIRAYAHALAGASLTQVDHVVVQFAAEQKKRPCRYLVFMAFKSWPEHPKLLLGIVGLFLLMVLVFCTRFFHNRVWEWGLGFCKKALRLWKKGIIPKQTMKQTIIEIDLIGYSDKALELEEHLGVDLIIQFNDQIQKFVDEGLKTAGLSRDEINLRSTGDGAIVVVKDALSAHRFAEAVHKACDIYNSSRMTESAKRWFRIGATTGDIAVRGQDIAGTLIARAVRLESAGEAGHLLVDLPTFNDLPPEVREQYLPEEEIRGKRGESFVVRRRIFLSNATLRPDHVLLTLNLRREDFTDVAAKAFIRAFARTLDVEPTAIRIEGIRPGSIRIVLSFRDTLALATFINRHVNKEPALQRVFEEWKVSDVTYSARLAASETGDANAGRPKLPTDSLAQKTSKVSEDAIYVLFGDLNPPDQLHRVMVTLQMPQEYRPPTNLRLDQQQSAILDWAKKGGRLHELKHVLQEIIRAQNQR